MSTHPLAVTGAGCIADFADSPAALTEGLRVGKVAGYVPLFPRRVSEALGLPINPFCTEIPGAKPKFRTGPTKKTSPDFILQKLLYATRQALADAGLTEEDLRDDGLQIIWATPGNQPTLEHFLSYVHENNELDLLFAPFINDLHIDNFRNDTLSARFREMCGLKRPVHTLYTACSSSITAVDLAGGMIRSGRCKRAIVLAWQNVNLFDVLYLYSLNILSASIGQPFCRDSDGVTVGFGVGCLVLESPRAALCRNQRPRFIVDGINCTRSQKGSANNPSLTVSFRDISLSIERSLQVAQIEARQVDCILPHGNGIRLNDQVEVNALAKIFGTQSPPVVVNYTYQLSYLLSASSIFDLIIAIDSFGNDRLYPFNTPAPPDETYALNFLWSQDWDAPRAPLQCHLGNILKIGIGIDGSIGTCILKRFEG